MKRSICFLLLILCIWTVGCGKAMEEPPATKPETVSAETETVPETEPVAETEPMLSPEELLEMYPEYAWERKPYLSIFIWRTGPDSYVCGAMDDSLNFIPEGEMAWNRTGIPLDHMRAIAAIYYPTLDRTRISVHGYDSPNAEYSMKGIDAELLFWGCEEIDYLRQEYPQFFGLDATAGLQVYMWQTAVGTWYCGLTQTPQDGTVPEAVWALENGGGVTMEQMRLILETYGVKRRDVAMQAIRMPHSDYEYTIDEAYCNWVDYLFWGTDRFGLSVSVRQYGESAQTLWLQYRPQDSAYPNGRLAIHPIYTLQRIEDEVATEVTPLVTPQWEGYYYLMEREDTFALDIEGELLERYGKLEPGLYEIVLSVTMTAGDNLILARDYSASFRIHAE